MHVFCILHGGKLEIRALQMSGAVFARVSLCVVLFGCPSSIVALGVQRSRVPSLVGAEVPSRLPQRANMILQFAASSSLLQSTVPTKHAPVTTVDPPPNMSIADARAEYPELFEPGPDAPDDQTSPSTFSIKIKPPMIDYFENDPEVDLEYMDVAVHVWLFRRERSLEEKQKVCQPPARPAMSTWVPWPSSSPACIPHARSMQPFCSGHGAVTRRFCTRSQPSTTVGRSRPATRSSHRPSTSTWRHSTWPRSNASFIGKEDTAMVSDLVNSFLNAESSYSREEKMKVARLASASSHARPAICHLP